MSPTYCLRLVVSLKIFWLCSAPQNVLKPLEGEMCFRLALVADVVLYVETICRLFFNTVIVINVLFEQNCQFGFKITVFAEIGFNFGVWTCKFFQGWAVSSHVVNHKEWGGKIWAAVTVVDVFPRRCAPNPGFGILQNRHFFLGTGLITDRFGQISSLIKATSPNYLIIC